MSVQFQELLDAGAHFGHLRRKWNPAMAPYIFMERNDIHIIDLHKTVAKIDEAAAAMKQIAKSGKRVLFVATKKQAKQVVADLATEAGMPYITERWAGGMLTNFPTIRKAIKKMGAIDKMANDGTFDALSKRERLQITRQRAKLEKNLGSIADLSRLPAAIFVVDVMKEHIAVAEAQRLGIPVFGIVDTNCDPDLVDYVIPGNDDAIRAVKLIIGVMNNAIIEANGGTITDYVSGKTEENGSDIMKRAVESVKRKEERKSFDKPFDKKKKTFDKKSSNKPEKEVKVEEAKKEEKVAEVKEVKETVKEKAAVKEDLTEKTVAELRELAKAKEVKGYSTMKKAELLEALK